MGGGAGKRKGEKGEQKRLSGNESEGVRNGNVFKECIARDSKNERRP